MKFVEVVVVVVVQFYPVLSLSRDDQIHPFLLQLLALRLSTCLNSGHRPSSNQTPPPPLASSRFFSVVLAFYCHSLQDSEQPSKHYRHPSAAYVRTI